ncbi:hypothetical protein Q3G72_006747 [Acer saccharum]|nr:hypothetical protein Q3G72_006747 [Acer saccharum]
MRKKYDKYWGSYQVINPFLFIAVLLDPRHKQRLLRYCFALLWGEDRANEVTSRVISTLNELYYQYKVIYFANMEADDNIPITTDMPVDSGEIDVDSLFNSGYMKLVKETDGEPLFVDEDVVLRNRLDKGRILVLISSIKSIPCDVKVVIENCSFLVKLKEDEMKVDFLWIERFLDLQKRQ